MALPLHRLARQGLLRQLGHRTRIRMSSTVVGKSGRGYVEGELLRGRRDGRNTFKADNEDNILVYPYFRGTLFELVQANPDLSVANRKEILRCLAEAFRELHSRDWIHLDVKPENVMVNWTCNEDDTKTITDVVLADFWVAWRMEHGEPHEPLYSLGHMAWRSPEAQAGRAMTKASDMYSFGLVCAYALGGGNQLLLRDEFDEQAMLLDAELEMRAMEEVISTLFAYFGPPTEGLLDKVNDEAWSRAFKACSGLADQLLEVLPEARFEVWGKDFGPEAQDMVFGLTKSDPAARLTIDQVLAHPWWQKEKGDRQPCSTSSSKEPPSSDDTATTTPRSPLRILHANSPCLTPATISAIQHHLLTNAAADPSRNPARTNAIHHSATQALYTKWLDLNFPRSASYIHHPLGPLQTDITFTFPDETTGLPIQNTIPAAQTQLHAIERVSDDPHPLPHSHPDARDADGKKRGGIVCVAMYAAEPERGAGVWDLVRWKSAHGSPAMEAAERALERACGVLAESGYGGYGAVGREAVEGCVGVVVMGAGMSFSEFGGERGFYDPPGGIVEELVDVEGKEWEEGGGKK